MHFRTISVSVLVFATMIAVRPASAACSNASLKGIFGFQEGRPGGAAAEASVGQFTADGKGNITKGSLTSSADGVISTGTFTGTYTISKNCTGSLTTSFGATFNMALNNGNKGFTWILNASGHVQPGFGLAQGAVKCGLPGKKQTFSTYFLGTLFPSGATLGIVGQLRLNGKGMIAGTETIAVVDTTTTVSVSGTYMQNSDCTGTAQITLNGFPTGNYNTVVVDDGKGLLLMETDANTMTSAIFQE